MLLDGCDPLAGCLDGLRDLPRPVRVALEHCDVSESTSSILFASRLRADLTRCAARWLKLHFALAFSTTSCGLAIASWPSKRSIA